MNSDTNVTLRSKVMGGGTLTGLSAMLDSVQIIEEFVHCGFDYIYIDQQHGLLDSANLAHALRAFSGSSTAPIVRVAENNGALIGRALDAGAHGVIVPMVEDRGAASRAVQAVKYPPEGSRSWGPIRARHGLGVDPAIVNERVFCLVMIESVRGLQNLEEIVSTDGVDGVYIGPADLSVSLGNPPTGLTSGQRAGIEATVQEIRDVCRRLNKIAGITGSPERRHSEGFSMVTANSDLEILRSAMKELQELKTK